MALTSRRTIRLQSWDYSQVGWYFVTVCTAGRERILAKVVARSMCLTQAGCIATRVWVNLPGRFPGVQVDAMVVMPDHMHGIIRIVESGPLLGTIVRSYKAAVTKTIRAENASAGNIWQRNYYERIIRDSGHLAATRRYILGNPGKWIARHGDDIVPP